MTKTVYRVRNWRQYNKSLVSRGSITFWISEDAVKSWNQVMPTGKKGRPHSYNEIAIMAALTVRQLFRLSLRQTEGFVQSILELMHTSCKSPDYTTLSRRASTLKIDIHTFNPQETLNVLVDSTGIKVVGERQWKILKHGKSQYQVWKKLHITIDPKNYNILSARMTDSARADGNQLESLLKDIQSPIVSVTGDGAYDKKQCYNVIYKKNARAIIPVQYNAIVQRNKYKKNPALETRDDLIQLIGQDGERTAKLKQWKIEHNYHQRSLIETMMFRMKTIFGDEMRSKNTQNQSTDLMLRCRAMNMINTLGLPISEKITLV